MKKVLGEVLEKEFLPLVASYQDEQIKLEMQYLAGKQPCKGISAVEVHSAAQQLMRICTVRKDVLTKDELLVKLNASLAAFTKMDPQDSVESQMITQMIAIQDMTMAMIERAFITDQFGEVVDQCVNRITKLTRSYSALVDSYTKYRTKGQQKITVQHVHVENGGQAIVGDVSQGGGVSNWRGPPHGEIIRCGAKTRTGRLCGHFAMKNGRCRYHGGKSSGAKLPRVNNGMYTKTAEAEAEMIKEIIKDAEHLVTTTAGYK
jgi:hypothetical protein